MSNAVLPSVAEGVRPPLASLSLTALGVVFGDIGTSPLYTLKTVLDATGAHPSPAATLGALSLIVWTLIIITTVKYVLLAMRVDNDGEGGILALMSLLGIKRHRSPLIVLVGLFGAALIYGDGAITPAISVLSALEGTDMVTASLHRFVLPLAAIILVTLFAVQHLGTARIGGLFGPVMAAWFLVIALLGIAAITRHPAVLAALDPRYGLAYLGSGGMTAFLVLGGVFLCVTGAEALYADMGHFGAGPIRLAWSALVFPSLLLNYAGQAAWVLAGGESSGNIFYRLCPAPLLVPLVLLATVATIIASQSIVTGAFSMTRQAIQLGWLPRMPITQTSARGYGQIYVGPVNWLLMLVTLGLTLGFGSSDRLAAAYGIAVSATMLMTSVLLFIAMRQIWRWPLLLAVAVAGALMLVDAGFVVANMLKVANGGYVPVVLAVLVYSVMLIWHRGSEAVAARLHASLPPIETFMQRIEADGIARVPGTAVFLTRTKTNTPPVLIWYVRHTRSLHERLFILSVVTELVPRVDDAARVSVQEIAPHVWRALARFGFMERPDVPKLLQSARDAGCAIDPSDVTYFVGLETIVPQEGERGLRRWLEEAYALLQRNSAHVTDYFRLPAENVMEIGREIAI
jgi:KUP system potassium uptake protein